MIVRYSQIIDMESLNELALLVEQLRSEGTRVIFTGLHEHVGDNMKEIPYFSQMLQEEQSIFRIKKTT